MARITFLGKTIDALYLLRQAECPLSKDARTLLVLIDGKRHERELKRLAATNGVESFEESLAYLRQAGLIQELGDTGEDALTIDAMESDYPDANLITMDFTRQSGFLNNPTAARAPMVRAGVAPPQPAPVTAQADAGKHAPGPDMAAAQKLRALQEQAIRARLVEHLRPRVEEELRARLLPELRTRIVRELTVKLEAALRPQVEKRLHARLEAELKPRIEQEFRARLEAQAAARSGALAPCAPEPDAEASSGESLPASKETDASPVPDVTPAAPFIEPLAQPQTT